MNQNYILSNQDPITRNKKKELEMKTPRKYMPRKTTDEKECRENFTPLSHQAQPLHLNYYVVVLAREFYRFCWELGNPIAILLLLCVAIERLLLGKMSLPPEVRFSSWLNRDVWLGSNCQRSNSIYPLGRTRKVKITISSKWWESLFSWGSSRLILEKINFLGKGLYFNYI